MFAITRIFIDKIQKWIGERLLGRSIIIGWRNRRGLRVGFQGTGSPLNEFLGKDITVTRFFPFHHFDEWRFDLAYDPPNAFACNGRFEI